MKFNSIDHQIWIEILYPPSRCSTLCFTNHNISCVVTFFYFKNFDYLIKEEKEMCKFSAILILRRMEPSSQSFYRSNFYEINSYRIFFLWFLVTLKLLMSNLHNKKHFSFLRDKFIQDFLLMVSCNFETSHF